MNYQKNELSVQRISFSGVKVIHLPTGFSITSIKSVSYSINLERALSILKVM